MVVTGAADGVECLLGTAHREPAIFCDLFCDRERALHDLIVSGDFVGEADAQAFLRVDDAAGVDQLARLAETDQARQSVGAAGRRNDAEFYFGLAHLGRSAEHT